mmetsp:Transcript_41654/g.111060  ORF Transcript_41654/g.111060 Transcript_41654/m.111060 type:complete len:157 (+) Transcript_41654:150-620(+)
MALLSPHSEELGSRRRRTAAYVDTEGEGEALPVRARRFGEHDGTPTNTPPTQSYGPFGAGDADSHLDDSHSDVLLRGRRPHPAADDDDACAYHLPPLPHSFGAGPDCEAGCTRESEVGEEQQDRVLAGIGERGFGYFLHTRPLQWSLPAQRETVPR